MNPGESVASPKSITCAPLAGVVYAPALGQLWIGGATAGA